MTCERGAPSVSRFDSYYASSYRVALRPYEGHDTSKICCLFAGQGGGMREALAAAFTRPAVREAFDAADALAKRIGAPEPSSYVTAGDGAESQAAASRMLAQFTLQVALWRELTIDGPKPAVITGFSSGEFAAIVAAGIASFESVFEILAFRESASPPPNEIGSLIAVALGPSALRQFLPAGNCTIANVNSPRQTVIAVRPEALREIEKLLRRYRLPFRVLHGVPQPFHTPWLQHVADQVTEFVRSRPFEFAPPAIPLFSSVTKRFLTADDVSREAMAALLGAQIVEPVDFMSQIEAAYKAECVSFLEVGAARVLSNFVGDILGTRFHKILMLEDVLQIGRPQSAAPADPAAQASPFFALLRNAIARVTGYEIESITIEDRFQEDLGIDSIKKADIVFTVLSESDRELTESYDAASIRNVFDAVSLVDRAAPAGAEAAGPLRRGHFVRCVETWTPVELPSTVAGGAFRTVPLSSLIDGGFPAAGMLDGGECGVVIDATSGGAAVPLSVESVRDALLSLRRFFAAFRLLAERGVGRDFNIVLATLGDGDPLPRALCSFFKSLRVEHPRLFFKHLEVDRATAHPRLLEIAQTEASDGRGIDVRYEGNRRFVLNLAAAPEHPAEPLAEGAVIVAFGAARGSGFEVLERLARLGSIRLLLAGRSAVDDEVVATSLERLRASGVEVEYQTADARDAGAVRRVLESARSRWQRVDVVVNAVGFDSIAPLAMQSDSDISTILESKIAAAANILLATRDGLAERSIHFSSSTSRYGNPGQTAYACANEFVNRMVELFNRESGRVAAVAINWPPWDGIGMTARPGVYLELRRSGLALMTAEDAAPLFLQDIAHPLHSVIDYADLEDTALYEAPLHDQRPLRPLLGDPTLNHAFERVLGADEEWLRDHRIDGISYLPAATALTMALAIGESGAAVPRRNVEEFEILAPLAVPERGVTLRLEMRARGQRTAFSGKTAVPHFQALLAESPPLDDAKPYTTAGRRVSTFRLYRRGLFFHGPSFQTLHRASVDEGVLVVRIEARRLTPIYGLPLHDRLTQWIDASFQALALEAYRRESVMALPAGARRVSRSEEVELASDVQLRVSYGGREGNVIRGDVTVATLAGKALVQLEGITLNIVPNGGAI
jgi:malonyl CoA-acyl carrier protein transacylase/NAD(P)-dependent dehydrogenase (short-subunit alcohol dehydrogenase family)/acyl carrier protein